jgi:hypothetical protein
MFTILRVRTFIVGPCSIAQFPFLKKNSIWYCGTKMKSEEGPLTLESRLPWLLGRCSRQLRKSCVGANMVYSRAERVFVLEHYFASKSFAAVCEAFSNAYPDNEVPNNTIKHRLVTTFRDTVSVCL